MHHGLESRVLGRPLRNLLAAFVSRSLSAAESLVAPPHSREAFFPDLHLTASRVQTIMQNTGSLMEIRRNNELQAPAGGKGEQHADHQG